MSPITHQELQELAQRIINSGALGRSRTYKDILLYLVECSINGDQPKEVAIAMDVLGRDADFDVGKDSIVRVHLYHLRTKLNTYFEKYGASETWRLEIPKGQYILNTVPNVTEIDEAASVSVTPSASAYKWLLLTLVVAIGAFIAGLFVSLQDEPEPIELVRQQAPWQAILDDQTPILVVVGDYFIFGELDDAGNVDRMVRDFNVNSDEDLDALLMMQPDLYNRYYNLGLSYIPNGTASALSSIMPVLYDQQHRISVRMMSELNATDLTNNHIIYVGYISGLGLLEERMFASSHLNIGITYDEVFTNDGDYYVSDSGILNTEQDFRDYGMISSFMSPKGNQYMLIAGMRDAGLISVAQELTQLGGLEEINQNIIGQVIGDDSGVPTQPLPESWEALYEVFGFDHTSFDARLIYGGELNSERIWGGEF